MAVKFDTVKAGDVLYSVYRVSVGNTTRSLPTSVPVVVKSIDADGCGATATANGRTRHYSRAQIERLRRSPGRDAR